MTNIKPCVNTKDNNTFNTIRYKHKWVSVSENYTYNEYVCSRCGIVRKVDKE